MCVCMCVYMYVCVYVCVCVCMCLYMYVCMFACVYVCVYVCLYVCMYVCMYMCMYVCMRRMSARSDVSSWRSVPTIILYLVFAVSCCTSVVTAAEKAGSNMRTTEKIKSTFKEALRTKKIKDETPTVKIPTQNFDEFTKLLTPQEWKSFEEQEQWFKYITGDNCDQQIYIQSNPESWWKLVDILNKTILRQRSLSEDKIECP